MFGLLAILNLNIFHFLKAGEAKEEEKRMRISLPQSSLLIPSSLLLSTLRS